MTPRSQTGEISRRDALDALRRSGYLLESRVEAVLRTHNFRVETNTLFPDDTSGAMRELDVWAGWAMALMFGDDAEHMLTVELVMECIHPPQPIAFITKERPEPLFERRDFSEAIKLVGNPAETEGSPHNMWDWLPSQLEMQRYHHYYTKRLASQYCSFQRKQGQTQWMALHRDEDHQSFRKLCVATDHFIRDAVNEPGTVGPDWQLTFVFPVLVVQGKLYEVIPSKRSARIVQRDHLQYRLRQKVRGEEQEYQVDVITERHFPRFLETISRDLRLTHTRLKRRWTSVQEFHRTRQENIRRYSTLTAPAPRTARR